MFVSVVVNLVILVSMYPTSVIMFFMMSNPHKHKNAQFNVTVNFSRFRNSLHNNYTVNSRPYTVTPSINTDLKGH